MSSPPASEAPRLRRTLSLWQVTASGVGIVIGAGIYVLVGEAAKEAGNAIWLAFIVAAAVSALTGLSYAELAGMYPSAGAEFAFAREAFGRFAGFISGWVMIAGNLIGAAAVAIGFGHYVRYFADVDARLAALLLLSGMAVVIAAGLQRSIWLTVALVALQVAGLVLVIVAGWRHVGEQDLLGGAAAGGVMSAAALVFFAFIGFDEVVTLSEETVDAAKTIPRALLLSLAISTGLYVAVAIAAVSTAGYEALAGSETPLALVIQEDWGGRAPDVIAVIALASTTNTTLLVLTAASRLIYSMASGGYLPALFARVNRRGQAPYAAGLAAFAVSAAFALTSDIGFIASVTDFVVFLTFLVVNGAVMRLRLARPAAERTMRVPMTLGVVPLPAVAGFLLTLAMMGSLEPGAWALGFGVVVTGTGAWFAKAARASARA
jgi:APA family basic amino acid/polyamine antiporter